MQFLKGREEIKRSIAQIHTGVVDPDPHQIERHDQDPDPHQCVKLDPVPHQGES
jgi:hypothetical protein